MKLPYWKFDPLKWISQTRSLPSEIRGPVIDIQCELWMAERRGIKTMILGDWCRILGILDPAKTMAIFKRLEEAVLVNLEVNKGGPVNPQVFFGVTPDVTQSVTVSIPWILRYGDELDSTSERMKNYRDRKKGVTVPVTVPVTAKKRDRYGNVTGQTLDFKTLDVKIKTTTDIVAEPATQEGSTPAGYGDLVAHIRQTYKAGPGKGVELPVRAKEGKQIKALLGTYGAEVLGALWDEFVGRSWDWVNRDNKTVRVPRNLEVFESKIPVLLEEGGYKSRIEIKKTKEEESGEGLAKIQPMIQGVMDAIKTEA